MGRGPGIGHEVVYTGIHRDVVDIDRVQDHSSGGVFHHVEHRPIQAWNRAGPSPVRHRDPEFHGWRCSEEVCRTAGVRIGDSYKIDRTGTTCLIYGEIDD